MHLPRIELHHVDPLPRPISTVQEVEPAEAYATEWDLVIQSNAPEAIEPRLRGRIDVEQLILTAAEADTGRLSAAGAHATALNEKALLLWTDNRY